MGKVAYSIGEAARAACVSEQTICLALGDGSLTARVVADLPDSPIIDRRELQRWVRQLPAFRTSTPQPTLRAGVA